MTQGALGRLYRDGQDIVRQGDDGECMFVIQSGRVQVILEQEGQSLSADVVEVRFGQPKDEQRIGKSISQVRAAGHEITCRQSNAEHELVDLIHQAKPQGVRFIVINPAGYTHTSVALRDALSAVDIPFIEVHLSNIHAREEFRRVSYFSDLARGVICGLGAKGYELALLAALQQLEQP